MGQKALLVCIALVVLCAGLAHARNLPHVHHDSFVPQRSQRSSRPNDNDAWITDTVDGRWEKALRRFYKPLVEFAGEFDRVSDRIDKRWPGYQQLAGGISSGEED